MAPRSLALLIAVLAVVAVSGCTGLPGGGSGNAVTGKGVVIENFEADFPQAFSGEAIQFQVRVRNTGSVDVMGTTAFLLGLDGWTDCTALSKELGGTEGRLLAPDPVRGTAGESDTHIWRCKAPTTVSKGLSLTSTPTLRLFYKATSDVIKSVTLASQDELRRVQDTNQPLPAETLSATSSPVALSIVAKGPIRVFADDNKVVFPVEVQVSNVGGGVACSKDIAECREGKGWNEVLLRFTTTSSDVTIKDCLKDAQPLVLWRGQSNSVVCTVEATGITTQSGPAQRLFQAHAEYVYFTDKQTTVTVTGK